jgi:archaellum component FlaC
MIKKIFSFIKGLFVKIDKLEKQAEVLIDKSAKYAPGLASDAKNALHKIDEIEERVEAQINESEVVAEKIEKAVETKDMGDVADAIKSSEVLVEDVKKEVEEIKNELNK